MNVHEYGNRIRINAGEDITAANNTLTLKSPSRHQVPMVITIDNGLLTPAVNVDTNNDGTYLANEYVEYRFKAGDINQIGNWQARLSSEFTVDGDCKISDQIVYFEVTA